MFPKNHIERHLGMVKRDDKTPDLFDPLTADFVEKLGYLP
jgi:hypothetical protein